MKQLRSLRTASIPPLPVDARSVGALWAVVLLTLAPVPPARAVPVAIQTVTVGNAGNPGESQSQGVFGSVDYEFAIGTYEVTAGQYTAFLNAVGATDTYGLWHPRMDYDADTTRYGCNIKRQGVSGSYTYSVAPDWANRPVNHVSWADAVRFANWLHHGQPTGGQDSTTTERGSYAINGLHENNDGALENVLREPGATWALPSENEWYKAAYHKNDGATGNYWNYPTSHDAGVSYMLIDPDPGNNATFSGGAVGVWTIGPPYYRTEVGAHENSGSPYGTFDLGGNVMEFTEGATGFEIRIIRGGSWFWGGLLGSWERDDFMHSSDQFGDLGFRVVNVGPASTAVPPLDPGAGLRFSLLGPHPVRDQARFRVDLPRAGRVRIDFFDVAGRRAAAGIDTALPAGVSTVPWTAGDLPSGVYLVRVSAHGRTLGLRLVLMR